MGGQKQAKTGVVVEEFLKIVENEMERQGITMSELARRAHCGRPYLYRVLGGEQIPTMEWAEKVAAVLQIQISFDALAKGA